MADESKYDIVAATGCPTGIAHTFMAKEALEKAAAAKGLTIKVETHGQVGVENELTAAEIKNAKAVVVAADKDVQAERFAGKPMVNVGVTAAIKDAEGLIDRALVAQPEGELAEADDAPVSSTIEKESVGHIIYKHLMNGVSHMLVFVVAGGVLTAVSFLWGITSFSSTAPDYNSFAAMLKIIGGIAMGLMVPVLSAYIAESIGKRPALVPGFVAGMIAIQGLPINPNTGMIDAGGAGVGFGFLGGIVGGFLAGYVIVGLEKLLAGLPKNLDGLKAIFLYPLLSTTIVGLVMLGISGPMAAINTGMMNFLRGLSASGPIVLGLAIGCMCAFDMGGPVNKAAYVTGTALLTRGRYSIHDQEHLACHAYHDDRFFHRLHPDAALWCPRPSTSRWFPGSSRCRWRPQVGSRHSHRRCCWWYSLCCFQGIRVPQERQPDCRGLSVTLSTLGGV